MYPHQLHNNRHIPDEVCCRLGKSKQLVEIILLKSEILQEVEADVQRIERMRKIEATPTISNDSDYYDIARDIDNAVGEVVQRCTAYLLLPSPFVHRISTNHIHDWEEKSIYLALPHNWPPHDIEPLRNAIHGYIVKSVVLELLSMAIPDDRYLPILAEKKERDYNKVNAIISARLGKTDLIQTPFG